MASAEVRLVHLRADYEELRATCAVAARRAMEDVMEVSIALSRTPPKVEISRDLLGGIAEEMRLLAIRLEALKP